jgi:hypothetical protein
LLAQPGKLFVLFLLDGKAIQRKREEKKRGVKIEDYRCDVECN